MTLLLFVTTVGGVFLSLLVLRNGVCLGEGGGGGVCHDPRSFVSREYSVPGDNDS